MFYWKFCWPNHMSPKQIDRTVYTVMTNFFSQTHTYLIWWNHGSDKSTLLEISVNKKFVKLGGSPGTVVMAGDSSSEGRGFESQHRIMDGHFSHIFVVKIVFMFVWKDKNKQLRDREWLTWIVPIQKCRVLVLRIRTLGTERSVVPRSVWPEKNRQMSIKVAQNDFTRKMIYFDTFTKSP